MVQQGTADWSELLAQLTAAMENGVDPADPALQKLEQRRQELVNAFTGGDAAIKESLTRMWTEQGDKLASQFGYDPKLMEYLAKVAATNVPKQSASIDRANGGGAAASGTAPMIISG